MKCLIAVAMLGLGAAAMAAPKSPREVVAAKFEAVNRHSVAEVVASYAEDAQLTASDFCKPRAGRAEVERTYTAIFKAVPDVKVTIRDMVAEGQTVAVRFVLNGTVGGHAFRLPIANVFTVRDGLIASDDGYFDNGGRACTP